MWSSPPSDQLFCGSTAVPGGCPRTPVEMLTWVQPKSGAVRANLIEPPSPQSDLRGLAHLHQDRGPRSPVYVPNATD